MSFSDLENKVEMWGYARGIVQNGRPMGQAIKTMEETTELLDAINKGDRDAIKDAVGDIVVTLLMQCAIQRIPLTECLQAAYDQIKDRKGFLTPEGVFIKQV